MQAHRLSQVAWLALRIARLTAILQKIRERRRRGLEVLDVAFPDGADEDEDDEEMGDLEQPTPPSSRAAFLTHIVNVQLHRRVHVKRHRLARQQPQRLRRRKRTAPPMPRQFAPPVAMQPSGL